MSSSRLQPTYNASMARKEVPQQPVYSEAEIQALKALAEKIGNMSDEEFSVYLYVKRKREERETKTFMEAVNTALANEGAVTTPDRFDQIADQIERAAPNNTAEREGIRALGRLYSRSRKPKRGK